MKYSLRKGFSFGLTSAVITTLGLMVGLYSGTYSTLIVLGGILSIAVADSCSDALGIHVSEEACGNLSLRELWIATLVTFFTKVVFALTFMIPVLLFPLNIAIWVSVAWGTFLIGFFSMYMAKKQGNNPWWAAAEHIFIMLVVIVITYFIGHWISNHFV